MVSHASQNRLFQGFLEWCSIKKLCARHWTNTCTHTCSRFAIAKFARCNDPLKVTEVEISALYTVGLPELIKQH